jgi:hypothetical protein
VECTHKGCKEKVETFIDNKPLCADHALKKLSKTTTRNARKA